ncbi:hypothetical protein GCM10027049_22440 [Mucilaginibacter puniceus]
MNKSNAPLSLLFIAMVITLVIPFIASCGKTETTVTPTTNTQLQVLNLSTDLLPVNLYVNLQKRNAQYRYPTPSGYFSLGPLDTLFQIRRVVIGNNNSSVNEISIDTTLKSNVKYTLFITGFKATNSISHIFISDTSAAPSSGRGKVRFVNATADSSIFNITANGTPIFTNQKYKHVSKFIEMPAGMYNFKIYNQTSTTTILSELPNVTVLDGKLYTLYCRGIVGRTDTAAFGMGVLNNR